MAGAFRWSGRIAIGLRLNQIRRPSHKIVVQEHQASASLNESPVACNPYVGDLWPLLSTRHNRRGNQGFADGHVESFDTSIFSGKASPNWPLDHHAYRKHSMLLVDE